jgi:uncharacterized repeat protein (TIGR01451 family)
MTTIPPTTVAPMETTAPPTTIEPPCFPIETVEFSASEGYVAGNLGTQNGWNDAGNNIIDPSGSGTLIMGTTPSAYAKYSPIMTTTDGDTITVGTDLSFVHENNLVNGRILLPRLSRSDDDADFIQIMFYKQGATFFTTLQGPGGSYIGHHTFTESQIYGMTPSLSPPSPSKQLYLELTLTKGSNENSWIPSVTLSGNGVPLIPTSSGGSLPSGPISTSLAYYNGSISGGFVTGFSDAQVGLTDRVLESFTLGTDNCPTTIGSTTEAPTTEAPIETTTVVPPETTAPPTTVPPTTTEAPIETTTEAPVETTIPIIYDYTIVKTQTSGLNPVNAAGQIIGYTITIVNTGTGNINGIVVTDMLPDGSFGVLTGPNESMTPNGILEVGETWTYTINYEVTQLDIDNGTDLVNTATIMSTEIPISRANSATTLVDQPNADFSVSKTQTGGLNPVTAAGQVINYTITVINTGDVDIDDIVAIDTLPDGTIVILTGPNESITPNGILEVGETWTYTINYEVTQNDINNGNNLVNNVLVESAEYSLSKFADASTSVLAPTTEPPTTQPATTEAPTTEAPVETTAPPTTIPLTTEAPVETTATPPETTAPPTTEPPIETTAPPTTAPPPDINFRCSSSNANTVNITIYTGIGFDYLVKRSGIPIGSVLSGNNADQVVVDNTLPGVGSYSYTVEILETGDEILVRTDGPFSCMTVCILPGAQIQTANGFKLIEDVVSGDLVIDEHGQQVTVTNNIRFGFGRKKVVTFTKGSLGSDLPTAEMAITYGHPIKILNKNGQFTENAIAVQYLVNDQSIVMKSRDVDCTYTLMTEQKTFVMTNGIPVATYSVDGFEESCANYKARNMIMLHSLQ